MSINNSISVYNESIDDYNDSFEFDFAEFDGSEMNIELTNDTNVIKKRKRKRYHKNKTLTYNNTDSSNSNSNNSNNNNNNNNNSKNEINSNINSLHKGDGPIIHTKHILYSNINTLSHSIYKYVNCTQKKDLRALLWNIFKCKVGECSFEPLRFIRPPSVSTLKLGKDIMKNEHLLLFKRMLKLLQNFPYQTIMFNTIESSLNQHRCNQDVFMEGTIAYSQLNIENLLKYKEIPIDIIYRYLLTIINRLLPPKTIWGSIDNMKQFKSVLLEYLSSKRYTTIYFDEVVTKFKVDDFLIPKMKCFRSFLWWMFEDLVPSIISNQFYCTDTLISKVYKFYLKQDWNEIVSIQLRSLKKSNYTPLLNKQMNTYFKTRRSGFSCLRFLPKEKSLRPIANLGRENTKLTVLSNENCAVQSKTLDSGNNIMSEYLPILKYHIQTNKDLIGSTVFNQRDIYNKLLENKSSFLEAKKYGPVYLTTIDINKCFDCIDQDKLMDILLKNVIIHDLYKISSLSLGKKINNAVLRKKIYLASPPNNHRQYLENQIDTLKRYPNITDVICSTPVGSEKQLDKRTVLDVFNELIHEHIIRYGKNYFVQTKGIPQGSKCSTLLCCLHLGDLERNLLIPKLEENSPNSFNFIMRYVDDYIYITNKKSNTDLFLDIISNDTSTTYGVKSNDSKTISYPNEQYITKGLIKLDDLYLPWCGILINVNTLEVLSNFSKLGGKKLLDTLSFPNFKGTWKDKLVRFLIFQIRYKLDAIYIDAKLNKLPTVFLNLYRSFYYLAMTFCCWVKRYSNQILHEEFEKSKFLKETLIHFAFIVFLKVKRKQIKTLVRFTEIKWMLLTAFCQVFAKKNTIILQILRKELLSHLKSIPDYSKIECELSFLTDKNLIKDILEIIY